MGITALCLNEEQLETVISSLLSRQTVLQATNRTLVFQRNTFLQEEDKDAVEWLESCMNLNDNEMDVIDQILKSVKEELR